VISDCRIGAPRGALERNFGDGAAAFLVADSDVVAGLEATYSITDEIQDVWRTEGDPFTHSWEDRFAVSQGYTPRLVEAVNGLLDKVSRKSGDFAKVAFYGPDARAHAGAGRKLGLDPAQVQDPLFGRVGNSGAAAAPLLLATTLETAKPGESILLASYGDGADALSFRITDQIDKLPPRRGVSWHIDRRRPLKSYDSYLRSRGLDRKEWDAGSGGGLSATIRYRERDADIAFVGARCVSCGLVHFPQPRVCYQCHEKDQWEPYRLSDKRGRLLAHTFDYFFPTPEPPAIMIMVEIDGCRVQIQLADALPEDAQLDMPVDFVFPKIHDAGGKPNYFWKARPIER
jgi:uncharacterized OB-fold protein